MRLVLDYGGVLADHVDEREYAHLLGVSPDRDPYPGWLAYYLFRTGFLDTEAQYVDLLSTLTGATEADCREYVERTWLDPAFPKERVDLLSELATQYSLVLLGNMVKPWIETVLRDHGAGTASTPSWFRASWNGRSHTRGATSVAWRERTRRS